MTLDYKILWFEDEESWYEAILPDISEHLTELGFTLVPKREDNSEELNNIFKKDSFDLILMDFNLLGDKGDVVIENIRNLEIYTNVIFYSQAGEAILRDSIAKKGLDGVFCAHRSQDEFLDRVKEVIYITIKKVVDLNNTRGLVMAYTSELDTMIEELIKKILSKMDTSEANKNKETIKTKFIESLKDRLGKTRKIDTNSEFEELISLIDSNHKWRAILRLCKNVESLNEFISLVENYKTEIIDRRNILAHVSEEIDERGNKKLKSRLKGHGDFIFNEAESIEIRNNIKKYAEVLKSIEEKL